MTLAFSLVTDPPALVASDAVVAGVYEDRSLSAAAAELDRAAGGTVADPRRQRLREGVALLLSDDPGRAERVQLHFSREYDDDWRDRLSV